ncbi:hypothetical protein J7643_19035 [bacterium]|nr:hypothetical protein [bacterium]
MISSLSATRRAAAPAPSARATATSAPKAVMASDTLKLSNTPEKDPARKSREWGPVAKISLMASPVVAGAVIGGFVAGPPGVAVGVLAGAAVSVVGLWWAMTDKPHKGPDVPPEPPLN